MLCHDKEYQSIRMEAAITCGQLKQHWLRTRVFRRLNGVTATAPGLSLGHAMGLRLRSRLAKSGNSCARQAASVQLGSRLPAKSSSLMLGARALSSPDGPCVHTCIGDRIMSQGRIICGSAAVSRPWLAPPRKANAPRMISSTCRSDQIRSDQISSSHASLQAIF